MKFRWFPLEKIVVLLCFLQNVLSLTPSTVLTAVLIVGALSWKQEKARIYTPVIILLVGIDAIRAVNGWVVLRVLQILIECLLVYLFVVARVFQLPQQFGLYKKNSQDQKLSNVGYLEHAEDGLDICVYYPTSDDVESKQQANWYPHWNYADTIYETMHIDPRKGRFLPMRLMEFCISYLKTYKQHAYLNTTLEELKKYKVILMSHGLAGHKNILSCYATWYAARGWVVVSLDHRQDEIVVDFRAHIDDKEKCHQYIYDRRNLSLKRRNKQFKKLFGEVESNLLGKIFKKPFQIEEVMMFGHSFGGTTILSSGSRLTSHPLYDRVSRYVCLDPWLFPLSAECYRELHKPILFINTDHFVKTNPQFYELHKKKHRFSELNRLLTKFYIRYSDHLHHSDAIYVFGSLLKVMGTIKNFRYSTFFNDLTVYAMYLFEKGTTGTELIDTLNKEIELVRSNEPKFIVEDNKVNWND